VKLAVNNTNSLVKLFFAIGSITLLVNCSEEAAVSSVPVSAAPMAVAAAEIPESGLGIRSVGDETVEIDMSQIHSQELKDIYAYIDENIDDHVLNLQNWIQQPSISNTGKAFKNLPIWLRASSISWAVKKLKSTMSASQNGDSREIQWFTLTAMKVQKKP
jgi:hypothetical protein